MSEKTSAPKKKAASQPAPKVACGHCKGKEFSTKVFRAPPGEFDLRNPTEWLGTLLTAYVCNKCGHVEFFADQAR